MASFLKISTLLAIVSTLQTTLATPPACLLACVAKIEKQSKCSGLNDLNCICSSEASAIEKCLQDICPNNNADTAIDSFRDSCSGFDSASSASSEEESSSTQASSSEAASSSVEASSSEEASSSSSVVVESSSVAVESSSVAAETASSEAPKSTTSSSSSIEEVSSSSSEVASSSTGIATQSEDSAAKVGLGAMIGLIGAALL